MSWSSAGVLWFTVASILGFQGKPVKIVEGIPGIWKCNVRGVRLHAQFVRYVYRLASTRRALEKASFISHQRDQARKKNRKKKKKSLRRPEAACIDLMPLRRKVP
eukprot:1064925-Pelagomonas_calceolata.AAC.1